MAINIQGVSNNPLDVDPNSKALRSTHRPNDVLGSYRKAMRSGTVAAGLTAASRVFAFRWAPTPNTLIAVVRNIQLDLGGTATAFTAGFVNLDFFVSRTFSVLDTTGGTAGTYATNQGKLKTGHATSAGAQMYMTTTAAISGATDTIDTDAFATVSISVAATPAGLALLAPFDVFKPGAQEWPLVLANNEGFIMKATVPATGTWDFGITVAHDEYTTFQ